MGLRIGSATVRMTQAATSTAAALPETAASMAPVDVFEPGGSAEVPQATSTPVVNMPAVTQAIGQLVQALRSGRHVPDYEMVEVLENNVTSGVFLRAVLTGDSVRASVLLQAIADVADDLQPAIARNIAGWLGAYFPLSASRQAQRTVQLLLEASGLSPEQAAASVTSMIGLRQIDWAELLCATRRVAPNAPVTSVDDVPSPQVGVLALFVYLLAHAPELLSGLHESTRAPSAPPPVTSVDDTPAPDLYMFAR